MLPPVRNLEAHVVTVSPKTTWIVVEIGFEDGPSGWGEATLAGAEAAVLLEVAAAAASLKGKRLSGDRAALAALPSEPVSPARNVARRAVEQAVADAVARHLDTPLATLLGGSRRDAIPVYANINRGVTDRSPAAFAARAREVVSGDGYTAVKIAPFDGLHWAKTDARDAKRLLNDGLARIAAVRGAIGEAALLIDCHWRLSPVMARTVIRACEPSGLFWLEDALDDDAFDAQVARSLRSFANDRNVMTAGGELIETLTGARRSIDRGAWDVILPDLRCTGLRAGAAILELASGAGVLASLHNPVGPVLDRISACLASTQPEFMILERQVRESRAFDDLMHPPLAISNGCVQLGAHPGFGPAPRFGCPTRET